MNKSGLSNSGELTIVRLDRREYDAQDELTGTVELSNPHRREISSITLELTSWRHLSLPKSGKTHVEQSLELFPKLAADRDRRYGHDEKILRTNAMFAYTFGAIKKHPTIDYLDNGRIKHYLTCYVYKKSGLLSRERVIEKNQFQIIISSPTLEVDTMFPDRFTSYLQSRPHSSNDASHDFKARCNTHLMPGLPFLIELDMATNAEISSVQVSLHQVTRVSIGADEEDLGRPITRYVHEVTWAPARDQGHFRQKDSPRTVAHGRRSWLIEWHCPAQDARVNLPFEDTIYSITDEAIFQRGLSVKVEVEIRNSPTKLAAVIHNIEYRTNWTDSRRDQSQSLRRARSILNADSPVASIHSESNQGQPIISRRSSSVSARSATVQQTNAVPHLSTGFHHGGSMSLSHARQIPLTSPVFMQARLGNDYFGTSSSRPATAPTGGPTSNFPRLVQGAFTPGPVQLLARTESLRSNNTSRTAYSQRTGLQELPSQSDKITRPPASVRSSMTSAFEAMNLKYAEKPVVSPTRRQLDEVPREYEEPAPPPKLPLPAAPSRSGQSFILDLPSPPIRDTNSPRVELAPPPSPRPKKSTRLSRPAVILGVSQDTIQTRESLAAAAAAAAAAANAQAQSQGHSRSGSPRIDNTEADDYAHRLNDYDSGFSETSSFATGPGSPLARTGPGVVVNSTGYNNRRTKEAEVTRFTPAPDDGGMVMLG